MDKALNLISRLFLQNSNESAALIADFGARVRNLRTKLTIDYLNDFDLSKNTAAKGMIFLTIAVVALGVWLHWNDLKTVIEELNSYAIGRIYSILAICLTLINVAAFFWRVCLTAKYRSSKTCTNRQLPTCTVIVPAYNEGRQVYDTLRSVAQNDYPAGKLQIIAIDDGSKDDTWYWIQKAAGELSGRILTIRMPENGGKRKALYEGFQRSKAEILVTIDSDSLIETQTLRRLVSPLYFDKRIGAVAGNVRVLNKHEGIIPRMLDVSFAYGFEFIRSSQSMVGTVFCTPGALAAYRRDRLVPVIDKWLNQTFFGYSANIGEDRALTNWILRSGSLVTFQSSAVVHTNVPVNYEGLCRMFLRWARSNNRETIEMSKFIFSKFRSGSALGARINFILSCLNLVCGQILFTGLVFCVLWQSQIFIMQAMFGSLLGACIPAAFYYMRRSDSNALWSFAYNIFWITALSWIVPYSIFTCHKDRWLTREINNPEGVLPNIPISQVTRPAA